VQAHLYLEKDELDDLIKRTPDDHPLKQYFIEARVNIFGWKNF